MHRSFAFLCSTLAGSLPHPTAIEASLRESAQSVPYRGRPQRQSRKLFIPKDAGSTADSNRLAEAVGQGNSTLLKRRLAVDRKTAEVERQLDLAAYARRFPLKRVYSKGEVDGDMPAAMIEHLNPDRPKFMKQIRERPLDRNILEMIYNEGHGSKYERQLKKGYNWEHWVTKNDENLPVRSGSSAAKQTFGMGGKVKLMANPKTIQEFPVSKLPEVAFFGAPNSGRSSLINSILNQFVCPYGHLPGTTREPHFYNIGDRLVLVDLPGLGYYQSEYVTELEVDNAQRLATEYLVAGAQKKRNLRRVFLCVPNARPNLNVFAMADYLNDELKLPFSVVVTKSDSVPIRELARKMDLLRCELIKYQRCEDVMMTSALRLAGITKMQNRLATFARRDDPNSKDPALELIDNIV